MDIDRRGFLRLMGMAGAVAAVPKFVLAEPGIIVPKMPLELGKLRELAVYQIEFDNFVVRLDAFNGKEQFHVETCIKGRSAEELRSRYLRAREVAQMVLTDRLKFEKWNVRDMVSLPIPRGYSAPTFMRANYGN